MLLRVESRRDTGRERKMHCISQQVVTHCWGFGSLRVHCLLCCSSSRRTWTYRRPGFFSPHCNLNSHPALCSCRRNWALPVQRQLFAWQRRRKWGEPGKRREKRRKRAKYAEEVFAFVKMCERSCVCTSTRVRVATKASEPELKHRQSMCFNGDYVLTAAPAYVINYSLATTPELSSGLCYYHKPMVSCCFKRQWRGGKSLTL